MSTEKNVQIVKAFFAAVGAYNKQDLLELVGQVERASRRNGVFKGLAADGSIGAELRQMQRTPLAASHVQALRGAGKTVTHSVCAILARSGDPTTSFVYVEEGEVEVVNTNTYEGHSPFTPGPAQFMGEISH